MTSTRQVTVSTGSRLHFGLLTHRPPSGREFGGLGVMIDAPGWQLSVSRTDGADPGDDLVSVSEEAGTDCPETAERVVKIIERLRRVPPLEIPPLHVQINCAIPSHRGLGSGTQLALATARAIDACLDLGTLPVSELAQRTRRGLRSAVGTWGFEFGGLIADGGKLHSEPVGSLAAAIPFPTDWQFLLIFPRSSRGLSGDDEVSAFEDLPGMSPATTNQLCQLTLMELLPAVHDHDFERASSALTTYGQLVGKYFAPAQGGIFADPSMLNFSRMLSENGINGFAQSSWGPTCAVLCDGREMADQAIRLVRSLPETENYEFRVTGAMNRSATVEIREH